MTRMRLATWNVNSARLRCEQIARFVAERKPDVLCLQEIKCLSAEFPAGAFADMGLPHLLVAGQKGAHGVAIASRAALEPLPAPDVCREGHARAAAARIEGVEIHTYYVPAGGDEPDRAANPKFDHKLDFLERMTRLARARRAGGPLVITGDLNVAPGEFDVWSHRQMLKVVSHTPVETEAMAVLRAAGGFEDLVRAHHPEPARLFSWWSYRAADFRKSNRGLRLDHIWGGAGVSADHAEVYEAARAWERPSDHAPVIADIVW